MDGLFAPYGGIPLPQVKLDVMWNIAQRRVQMVVIQVVIDQEVTYDIPRYLPATHHVGALTEVRLDT